MPNTRLDPGAELIHICDPGKSLQFYFLEEHLMGWGNSLFVKYTMNKYKDHSSDASFLSRV